MQMDSGPHLHWAMRRLIQQSLLQETPKTDFRLRSEFMWS